MRKLKDIKSLPVYLLLTFVVFNSLNLFAQTVVSSRENTAGFRISSQETAPEPVIHYQQHIQMLSGIDDRPSLQVFSNGRVLVHYPVYMKKAGDYEMQLDDAELINLIQGLSSNGIMDFDEKAAKDRIKAHKKALKNQGQYYEISDAVDTVVDIRLDEYQKNNASNKVTNFRKRFKWKNIEHDAARYRQDREITKANNAVITLKALMKDVRLKSRAQP